MNRREILKAAGASMATTGAALLATSPTAAHARQPKGPGTRVHVQGTNVLLGSPENCDRVHRTAVEQEFFLKPGKGTWLLYNFPCVAPTETMPWLHNVQVDGAQIAPKDKCFVSSAIITVGAFVVLHLKNLRISGASAHAELNPLLLLPASARLQAAWGTTLALRVEALAGTTDPLCRLYGAAAHYYPTRD